MNKREYSFSLIFLEILLIAFVCYMTIIFEPKNSKINFYYQVYLGGEKIGLIKSEDELYELINNEQKEIKEKFNVNKVYPPKGLKVQKIATYSNDTVSVNDIYNDIKDRQPFTISGYEVRIKLKNKEDIIINILNKNDLDFAVKNTITAFLKEDYYNSYINGNQKSIDEEGNVVTDIYFDDKVSVKKTYLSSDSMIITDKKDLSRYFLFGKTELSKKYVVKSSDTIESIANNNKMGVNDFLIANPDIKGSNALIAAGQEVIVDPISPLASIVVDSYQTQIQSVDYETKTILDKTLSSSEKYVKQKGIKGSSKIVYKTKEKDGIILQTSIYKEEVISKPVDEIIVMGAKNVVYVGNSTFWAWPTTKPYRITSTFGWRRDPGKPNKPEYHNAIDISGVRSNDIFAIQNGVVKASKYNGSMGNYVLIDYQNGVESLYMHLSKSYVKAGDKVEKGQKVGDMGNTGYSFGKHLHFQVYKNGVIIDPLSLYE